MLRGRKKGRKKKTNHGPVSGQGSGHGKAQFLRLLTKPFTPTSPEGNRGIVTQSKGSIQCDHVTTGKETSDVPPPASPTKRKRMFGGILARSKHDKDPSTLASSEPIPLDDPDCHEENNTGSIPLESPDVRERVARLCEILNSSKFLPKSLAVELEKLDVIPEKQLSSPTSPRTFRPFAGCSAFGCNGAVDVERPGSPIKRGLQSGVESQRISSSSFGSQSGVEAQRVSSSNFGSQYLFAEGGKAPDDAVPSPFFDALVELAEALRDDPLMVPKLSERKMKMTLEHARLESYRLGYVLAHISLAQSAVGSSYDNLPKPDTTDHLRSVIQSIQTNAGNEQRANNALAILASEFAATSDSTIDRNELKRGYLRRVSELVHSTDYSRETPSSKVSDSEVIIHSKKVFHAIENVLDSPFDPERKNFNNMNWTDWSWLRSDDDDDDQQVTAVETALSEMSTSYASSPQEIRRPSGLIDVFSFFKRNKNSETDDSSEVSESSSDSSSCSSQSSGIEISVASKPKKPSVVRKNKLLAKVDDESEARCIPEKHEVQVEDSSIAVTAISSSADKSVASKEVKSIATGLDASVAMRNSELESDATQGSTLSERASKAISPYGFLSFIRAVSTIRTDSNSGENDQTEDCPGSDGFHLSGNTDGFEVASDIEINAMGTITSQGRKDMPKHNDVTRQLIETKNSSNEQATSTSLFRPQVASQRPPLPPSRSSKHTRSASKSTHEVVTCDLNEREFGTVSITAAREGDLECFELSADDDESQTQASEPETFPGEPNDSPFLRATRCSIITSTRSTFEDEVEVEIDDGNPPTIESGEEIGTVPSSATSYSYALNGESDRIIIQSTGSMRSTKTRTSTERCNIEVERRRLNNNSIEKKHSAYPKASMSRSSTIEGKSHSYESNASTTSQKVTTRQGKGAAPATERCNSATETVQSKGETISNEERRNSYSGVSIGRADESVRDPPSSLTSSKDSHTSTSTESEDLVNNEGSDEESDSQSETDSLATSDIASLLELLVGTGTESMYVSGDDLGSESNCSEFETVAQSEPGLTPTQARRDETTTITRPPRPCSVPPHLMRTRKAPAQGVDASE